MRAGEHGNRSSAVGHGASPFWDWNYWINCFTHDQVCVSFVLWALSQLFWAVAHIMVIYFHCKQRLWKEGSLFCVIYAFLGNMCNMFGALLAKQLSIQIFTAAYMAAVDILHFMLILFPVCDSRSKSVLLRHRKRRRRRTAVLIVCLPFVMGTSYYLWPSPIAQVDFRGPRRKLLTTLLQDGTEIIGYALGVTAIFIGWTSKLPLVLKATRGKINDSLQKCAVIFSMVASVLYATAILSQEKTPALVIRALPWLLIYLGGAALDISILYLLCLLKDKTTRQQWGLEMVVESDTISLLETSEQDVEEDELQANTQSTDWVPLNIPQNNRYLRKMAEIGHYMDLSIEPVQEIGLGVKRLPGDGQTCTERKTKLDSLLVHDPPMYPPKQVIHAKVSSCSSSDATSINSELEKYLEALNSEQWDFEDMPQQWKMTEKKHENGLSHNAGSPETIMTEERTSSILAQYEEELNRTGQRRTRSLSS
ncbi:transmembrane protein 44 isoform X2 [Pristis pectinata]|uniref:transmembrane protein 44 isoform X2 n=1 Tax=Pristis pectinata TaxID=685728 RepID=UPI00223DCF96|nr:transmembrane protein 44 isoform X2 [Pristis pectinata]